MPILTGGVLLRCRGCLALNRLPTNPSRNSQTRRVSYTSQADCHYKILDIKKDATQAEIKAAFVKKSKEVHPDRNPNDPTTHARFVRLNEAYTVLSRATSRREYDFSLAAQLAYQQNLRQYQGTQAADSSHMPGAGTYHGGQSEKPFHDETIFEMRDKTKDGDRFYQEDAYYGIKGVRRVSNSYIIVGCFALMGLGVILHLGAIMYSNRVARAFMDERDRKAHAHLSVVRSRAKERGHAKQLEILKHKIEARQNGIRPPPSDA